MKRQDAAAPARRVVLVGAGVVGRAIAATHLAAGVPVELVDTSREVLESAVAEFRRRGLIAAPQTIPAAGLSVADRPSESTAACSPPDEDGAIGRFVAGGLVASLMPAAVASEWRTETEQVAGAPRHVLVIESIVERREPKRELIAAIDQCFGDAAILATNTSSLRLSDLESASRHPERFCGLHFFMPVERREMVEVIHGSRTIPATLSAAEAHVRRINKQPLRVADSPGFVVNRILAPYLNQSMLMLGSGADHRLIRRVAVDFGMPFSPLELVDLIGARTAFDAGRAFWQAFPSRIDPAPVLPGMIKAGLGGRAAGRGFYDYAPEIGEIVSPATISAAAMNVIDRYRRDERSWSEDEIWEQLALPMLIEAACLLRDRVVHGIDDVERAMRGGLEFTGRAGFFASFDARGPSHIAARLQELGTVHKALAAPDGFITALRNAPSVVNAVERFARCS